MMTVIQLKLNELGIVLPKAAAPVASYVPTVESGGVLYVSGQLPFRADGSVITGRLGDTIDIASGQEAARQCGLMLLAQVEKALGSLDRVDRIIKLGVFVNSAADFSAHPEIANGASDLMAQVFGDAGTHARAAVGVAALPRGAAVEVDAIIAIKD